MRPEDPIAKHGLTGSQLDVQLVSSLSEKKMQQQFSGK